MIHILHPSYHPKIIIQILKKCAKKQMRLFSGDYMIHHNENDDQNEKYT